MFIFKKEGPPIIVEVYVDGRAEIFIPQPPTVREKTLSKLFQRSAEMQGIEPGRYHVNYTKVGLRKVEFELTSAE